MIFPDITDVRMRETPARNGMGGGLSGRPDQRHSAAADFVPAVPPLPALLPAVAGPLPRQTARLPRSRRQTGLAANPRTTHQLPIPRKTLTH